MGHLRLSCVFLANNVPEYQMSSGPFGPILVRKISILSMSQFWLCPSNRDPPFPYQQKFVVLN